MTHYLAFVFNFNCSLDVSALFVCSKQLYMQLLYIFQWQLLCNFCNPIYMRITYPCCVSMLICSNLNCKIVSYCQRMVRRRAANRRANWLVGGPLFSILFTNVYDMAFGHNSPSCLWKVRNILHVEENRTKLSSCCSDFNASNNRLSNALEEINHKQLLSSFPFSIKWPN